VVGFEKMALTRKFESKREEVTKLNNGGLIICIRRYLLIGQPNQDGSNEHRM
jgi:hypothetical protein